MRRLVTILLIALLSATGVEAQNLRLGERIPDIDLKSMMGGELDDIKTDYVCLVFIHADSIYAMEVFDTIYKIANTHSNSLSVVFLTTEQYHDEYSVPDCIGNYNITYAFDNKNRTLRAFGIKYVPFGVIFDSKRRRAQWFGSIYTLDNKTIEQIINQENN